jgi:hypothetical protein
MSAQFTDPSVSLAKFDEEVSHYVENVREYEARGWFLIEASFPEIFVILAAPALRPPAIVCGVLFDLTNYDAAPPSVKLVDPFTRIPYPAKELPTSLNRSLPSSPMDLPGVPGGQFQMQAVQPLMQSHSPDDVPFLCIAGVREYHDHPGHSGDSWELHRATGAGRPVRLLEAIYKYGVEPAKGYSVQLVPQVGLEWAPPPA